VRAPSTGSLVVVPVGTPDVPADPAELTRNGVPVLPDFTRVSIVAHSTGPSEFRVYYVPPPSNVSFLGGPGPVLAARAPVNITAAN
jgi:hypothetical protein